MRQTFHMHGTLYQRPRTKSFLYSYNGKLHNYVITPKLQRVPFARSLIWVGCSTIWSPILSLPYGLSAQGGVNSGSADHANGLSILNGALRNWQWTWQWGERECLRLQDNRVNESASVSRIMESKRVPQGTRRQLLKRYFTNCRTLGQKVKSLVKVRWPPSL